MEVHSVALKDWVLFDMDDDIKVSGRSIAKPGFAPASAAQPGSLVDPCGNLELHSGGAFHPSIAMTLATRLFDDPASSLAGRTRLGDLKEPSGGNDLTTPPTNRTRHGMRAFLRARAFADIAHVQFANFNFLFAAAGGFLQGDLHIITQIRSPLAP